jgi:predicted phage terminase large subunit-like protein
MAKLLMQTSQIEGELAKRKLSYFVKFAWRIIEPETPLIWNWHLDAVCDHVQAFLEKRLDKRNLIINVPPGSMKSTIISVMSPAWMWLHNPSWRGLFFSGNESVGLRDSMKCRDIIESEWYQQTFQPTWKFEKDQNAKGHYRNTASGFRKAQSAGSRVTGDRADDIFCDDPLDAAEAFSKPARDSIITWWTQAASNRLNDLRTGGRCIIMQRLHEEDLTGYVLKYEPDDWERLIIRQEYELNSDKTSLGWSDPRTVEGSLFFPERFPNDVIAIEKRRLGSYGYAGQHQQRPSASEGGLFKRADWSYYKPLEPKELGINQIIQGWDTAFKTGEENDYSACITIGVSQNRYYILDLWKQKVEYPELKRTVVNQFEKWKPSLVLIEDKASGQSLIQELRRDTRIAIHPYKVDRDKIARANSVTPIHEAKLCYLPENTPWVSDFIESLSAFPTAPHDDDVDAFVMTLNYASRGGSGLLQFMQLEAEKLKV